MTEEKDLQSQVQLGNADANSIRLLIKNDATGPKANEALQHAVDLKGKVEQARQELGHAQQQLGDIERDQARIRANLKETPPTARASKDARRRISHERTGLPDQSSEHNSTNIVTDLLQQTKKDSRPYAASPFALTGNVELGN